MLLNGPPGSGKDSLTDWLVRHDGAFAFARKVRDSAEGSAHHDIVTPERFDRMIVAGELVQWHARYGRRYGLPYAAVQAPLARGQAPIVHTGRLENLRTLRDRLGPCLTVHLACSQVVLLDRLRRRHAGDAAEIAARSRAMQEELDEVAAAGFAFDIVLDNDGDDPAEAGARLAARLRAALGLTGGTDA